MFVAVQGITMEYSPLGQIAQSASELINEEIIRVKNFNDSIKKPRLGINSLNMKNILNAESSVNYTSSLTDNKIKSSQSKLNFQAIKRTSIRTNPYFKRSEKTIKEVLHKLDDPNIMEKAESSINNLECKRRLSNSLANRKRLHSVGNCARRSLTKMHKVMRKSIDRTELKYSQSTVHTITRSKQINLSRDTLSDSFGIHVVRQRGMVTIASLGAGAQVKGLKIGDEVIALNGISCKCLSIDQLKDKISTCKDLQVKIRL